MQKNEKEKWVRLLKSGKFVQCFGKIQEPHTNQRCALGVGFEALGLNKNKFIEESLKLGLSFKDIVTISKLNDVEHKSFAQIADWINDNVRGELK